MNCRCQPGSQTFFHLAPKESRVCLAVPTSNVPGKNTAQLGQFGDLIQRRKTKLFWVFFMVVLNLHSIFYGDALKVCPPRQHVSKHATRGRVFGVPPDVSPRSPQQLSLKPNVIFLVEVQVSTGILGVEDGINQVTKEFRDLTGSK